MASLTTKGATSRRLATGHAFTHPRALPANWLCLGGPSRRLSPAPCRRQAPRDLQRFAQVSHAGAVLPHIRHDAFGREPRTAVVGRAFGSGLDGVEQDVAVLDDHICWTVGSAAVVAVEAARATQISIKEALPAKEWNLDSMLAPLNSDGGTTVGSGRWRAKVGTYRSLY